MQIDDSLSEFEPSKMYLFLKEKVSCYLSESTETDMDLLKDVICFSHEYFPKTFADRCKTAQILLGIHPDIYTLCAVFVLNFEEEEVSASAIFVQFGDKISGLVEGVNTIADIHYQNKKNAGIIQRFLLSQVENIRVFYLRFAQELFVLRRVKQQRHLFSEEKISFLLDAAEHVSIPLLAKLGLYTLKVQMQDVIFFLKDPKTFRRIEKSLLKTELIRKKYIEELIDFLTELFTKNSTEYLSITGRTKGVFSVFEKIGRKSYSSLEEVTDLLALRIITSTIEECYTVLNTLHSNTQFIESHFIDYIASPKVNGYQSIHTTLTGLISDDVPVEIQIRTEEMQINAEMGSAAHWRYKNPLQEKISSFIAPLRDMDEDCFDSFLCLKKSFPKMIYPVTISGERKELPVGATPIDFAYSIHSDIGEQCSGALVNGNIMPIVSSLHTNDIVEILTHKQKTPKPEWLNIVVSAGARHKIQNFLNKKREPLSEKEKKKTSLERDSYFLTENSSEKNPYRLSRKSIKTHKLSLDGEKNVIIGGEKNMLHHFAKCCDPQKTDDIVAYASHSRDFILHKKECFNLNNLEEERILDAQWEPEFSLQ